MPGRFLAAVIAIFGVCLTAPAVVQGAGVDIAALQRALAAEGYDPGTADGIAGPRTRAAIRAYEADNGLPVTGAPARRLLLVMQGHPADALYGEDDPGLPPTRVQPIRLRPPAEWLRAQEKRNDREESADAGADTAGRLSRHLGTAGAPLPVTPAPAASGPAAAQAAFVIANRNWLVRDFNDDGAPAGAPFGIFLEQGGTVAGPRFARRLSWSHVERRFTLVYRNMIGQEITRTARLLSPDRMEGHAIGPHGRQWRWTAEAEPL